MLEQPMSAAEFWWNHLTFLQRQFIHMILDNMKLHESVNRIDYAYEKSSMWKTVEGWPSLSEKDMRSI